jgi:hypothetical protein
MILLFVKLCLEDVQKEAYLAIGGPNKKLKVRQLQAMPRIVKLPQLQCQKLKGKSCHTGVNRARSLYVVVYF